VPRTCHFQRRTVHIGAHSCATESWVDLHIQRIPAGPEIATWIFPKLRTKVRFPAPTPSPAPTRKTSSVAVFVRFSVPDPVFHRRVGDLDLKPTDRIAQQVELAPDAKHVSRRTSTWGRALPGDQRIVSLAGFPLAMGGSVEAEI